MSELQQMPSSLNDACRKLDLALTEIERLRAALCEIANDPCLDPEGNRQIALLALNPSQEGT